MWTVTARLVSQIPGYSSIRGALNFVMADPHDSKICPSAGLEIGARTREVAMAVEKLL
jgi:hypothetical protein